VPQTSAKRTNAGILNASEFNESLLDANKPEGLQNLLIMHLGLVLQVGSLITIACVALHCSYLYVHTRMRLQLAPPPPHCMRQNCLCLL
jgi:hypothetical protein